MFTVLLKSNFEYKEVLIIKEREREEKKENLW